VSKTGLTVARMNSRRRLREGPTRLLLCDRTNAVMHDLTRDFQVVDDETEGRVSWFIPEGSVTWDDFQGCTSVVVYRNSSLPWRYANGVREPYVYEGNRVWAGRGYAPAEPYVAPSAGSLLLEDGDTFITETGDDIALEAA
jgi:hypothetical protein